MRRTTLCGVLVLTLAAIVPRVAAATCDAFAVDPSASSASDAELAASLADTAERARVAGCLEQADRLLEGAHRLEQRPVWVYRRILVREAMGDFVYARELLQAYDAALRADPAVEGLAETRARLAAPAPSSTLDPQLEVPQRRSTLDAVGPLLLGGAGLVALGFAVYGFTASCDVQASSGACLRGTEMAVGPTVAYAVSGVTAVTAGAVWWILAIPRPVERASFTGTGVALRF